MTAVTAPSGLGMEPAFLIRRRPTLREARVTHPMATVEAVENPLVYGFPAA